MFGKKIYFNATSKIHWSYNINNNNKWLEGHISPENEDHNIHKSEAHQIKQSNKGKFTLTVNR